MASWKYAEAADVAAVEVIQRCYRRKDVLRRAAAIRSHWPQLERLRKHYLDEEAMEAGAELSDLYTDESIVVREALRGDPDVRAALAEAWEACSQQADCINWPTYFAMARKTFLALELSVEFGSGKGFERGRADASECVRDIQSDFSRDGGDKGYLTRGEFEDSWFQLTDLYTGDAVDGRAYAE